THGARRRLACPDAGCVPGLQRDAGGYKAEPCLALFKQLDVLSGAFGCEPHHRKLENARQNPSESLAVDVIRPSRRCRADIEVVRPARFVGQRGGVPQQQRRCANDQPKHASAHDNLHTYAGMAFSGASASNSVSCSRCSRSRFSSRASSHFDTTTVATPLPMRLVSARASDMKRSTPRISAMLATGIWPTEASVAASTMKPLPVTPAAPFEVNSSTAMIPSCCHSVSSVFVACARKMAAMVR